MKIESLKAEIEDLKHAFAAKESELAKLSASIETLEMRLTTLITKIEEMESQSAHETIKMTEVEIPETEPEIVAELPKPVAKTIETSSEDAQEEPVEEVVEIGDAEHAAILKTIEELSANIETISARSPYDTYTERQTLSDKIGKTKLNDIRKAIGLNERFLFANELFGGDMGAFNKAIDEFNHLESESGAAQLMDQELSIRFGWDGESDVVQSFKTLVYRRFK